MFLRIYRWFQSMFSFDQAYNPYFQSMFSLNKEIIGFVYADPSCNWINCLVQKSEYFHVLSRNFSFFTCQIKSYHPNIHIFTNTVYINHIILPLTFQPGQRFNDNDSHNVQEGDTIASIMTGCLRAECYPEFLNL